MAAPSTLPVAAPAAARSPALQEIDSLPYPQASFPMIGFRNGDVEKTIPAFPNFVNPIFMRQGKEAASPTPDKAAGDFKWKKTAVLGIFSVDFRPLVC